MRQLLLIVSLILSTFVIGQKTEKGIEISPFLGKSFNLDAGIDYSFSAWGIQAKYIKQSPGDKEWQQYFNLPRMGQELVFSNYSINGYSIAANTFVEFDFLRLTKHELYISPSLGLVYVSETSFSLEDYQLASLPISVSGKFEIGYRYAFSPKWKASVGYFVNHFSNGNISIPNYGINVQAFKIGIQYNIGDEITPNFGAFEKPESKFIFSQVSFGAGVKEAPEVLGFINGYINVGINLHPYHRLVSCFNLFVGESSSHESMTSQFGYSFGYQILVGKLGVSILPGWYQEKYNGESRFYQFVLQYGLSSQFFIQSNLRMTGDFYSEDLGIGLGVEI